MSKSEEFGLVFNKYPKRRPYRYRSNWEEIKNAYIFAEPILHKESQSMRYPTLAEIAEKFNVSPRVTMLRATAKKPSWTEQRAAYHEKVRKLHDLEYGVSALRRSSEFDAANVARLDKFASMLDTWMDDLKQEIEHPQDESISAESKSKVLKDVIGMMKDMHTLHRNIIGEPVNYYEFFKEKMKEEKRETEKGKGVTRDDIRELISAVREEEKGKEISRTLDLNIAEELGLKTITISDSDEVK